MTSHRFERCDASGFASWTRTAVDVYAEAMARPPEVVTHRRDLVVSHLHRPDFRAALALDADLLVGFGLRVRWPTGPVVARRRQCRAGSRPRPALADRPAEDRRVARAARAPGRRDRTTAAKEVPYQQARDLRLTRHHGHDHWRVHHQDPIYQAANYPEVVTLAGLLASPHWRPFALSASDADHDRFCRELWRRLPRDYPISEPPLRNLRALIHHGPAATWLPNPDSPTCLKNSGTTRAHDSPA